MKKRDYYILAILACLVIYAVVNRGSECKRETGKIEGLVKQNTSLRVANSSDSLNVVPVRLIKAEI
ncbi:MAG: hypothetical protein ACK5JD_09050 [Mangrovibacterium sp.]